MKDKKTFQYIRSYIKKLSSLLKKNKSDAECSDILEVSKELDTVLGLYGEYVNDIKKNQAKTQYANTALDDTFEKLKIKKEYVELTVSGKGDGTWSWNIQTDEVNISPEWKVLLGYPSGYIEEDCEAWKKFIHPDDLEKLKDDFSHLLLGNGSMYKNEYRFKSYGGSYQWLLIIGLIEKNSRNEPTKMIGLYKGITDHKKLTAMLKQERDFANSILNTARLLIIVTQLDGTIVQFNKFAQQLTGFSETEVLGKRWFDTIIPDGTGEHMIDLLSQIQDMKLPQNFEHPLLGKDGRTIDILWNHSFIKVPEDTYMIVSMGTDITKRNQTENKLKESCKTLTYMQGELLDQFNELQKSRNALRQSEERYRLAIEGANDGLWDWDILNDKAYISPEWQKKLGFACNEIQSHHSKWLERIHPEDRKMVRSNLQEHFAGKTLHYKSEYRVKDRDGVYIWILSRGKAKRNADGKPVRMAGSYTDISERKEALRKINKLAYYDQLTGLYNQLRFIQKLKAELKDVEATGETGAIMFIDLDNFKTINDTLGHAMGDKVLKKIAKKLSEAIDDTAILARFGGDEFILLQREASTGETIIETAKKLMAFFKTPWQVENYEFYLTASMGITIYPNDGRDADELLKNVDTALYNAKELGKNSYRFFQKSMYEKAIKRADMEKSLRYGIEKNEFLLYYQPLIDAKTGDIVELEALVRWLHPQKGLISPLEFIPLAEEKGLIVPLGHWILEAACRQNVIWQQKGYRHFNIAVNISPIQLQSIDFLESLEQVLKNTGLAPQYLTLEITESALMKSIDSTSTILRKIKNMGIHISLDDFGTGYSSLHYLKKLPIDTLKMDKAFVNDINGHNSDEAITGAIIALAHQMRLDVVAEGVETKEQWTLLSSQNCDKVQGYLLSKPLPAEEVEKILRNGKILL